MGTIQMYLQFSHSFFIFDALYIHFFYLLYKSVNYLFSVHLYIRESNQQPCLTTVEINSICFIESLQVGENRAIKPSRRSVLLYETQSHCVYIITFQYYRVTSYINTGLDIIQIQVADNIVSHSIFQRFGSHVGWRQGLPYTEFKLSICHLGCMEGFLHRTHKR